MNVVGESLFVAARTFKGKKQQDLYTCKFLDEDGDEFFTLFTSEELFAEFEGVAGMLSCGRATARKIGEQAGARITIGRRVLYSVDAVKKYLETLQE